MVKQFVTEKNPSDDRCRQLELLDPMNPYCTSQYRNAMQRCGRDVWLLGTEVDGQLQIGCLGEVQAGRLRRELQIQSTPQGADSTFWDGITKFGKDHKITSMLLGTVGTAPTIPAIGELLEEKQRYEYWVDLSVPEPKAKLRPEQRRIFNRAVEAGLAVREPNIEEGLAKHRELTMSSLGRRRQRGESIPIFAESDIPAALLKAGVGKMYECISDGRILGSVILTLAPTGAHGYSAGYAPDGLKAGAGVFLNLSTFNILKAEGKLRFNLGDAPPNSGLALFKKGLGGEIHESRSARFSVASPMQQRILNIETTLRNTIATVQDRFAPRAP